MELIDVIGWLGLLGLFAAYVYVGCAACRYK